jgi:hypothetical protein
VCVAKLHDHWFTLDIQLRLLIANNRYVRKVILNYTPIFRTTF